LKKAISNLKSGCYNHLDFKELEDYHYQFLGLTVNQQEHIYVNAFIRPQIDTVGTYKNWKREFIDTCGGGGNQWGFLLNLITNEISFSHANIESNKAILKPSEENKIRLCTRCRGFDVESYFELNHQEICSLESNFDNLRFLTSRRCNSVGRRINFNFEYAYQYVGIVVGGQKMIYVNGNFNEDGFILDFLQDSFLSVCDGGIGFWGVLFDLESLEFYNLQFNGVR